MKCVLCEKNINEYNQKFNQLKLSKLKAVNICHDCIQKFTKWQQKLLAKLYPTTFAKKWVKRNRKISL